MILITMICNVCNINKPESDFATFIKKYKEVEYEYLRHNCRKCESERRKIYRELNRESESTYHKQYRQKNKVKIRAQLKFRKQKDPLFAFIRQLRVSISLAITKYNYEKCKSVINILGCDKQTLVNHIEQKFSTGMGWSNYGKWHIDHIVPLKSAKNKEDILRLNHYTNLQPLWALDNLKKGAKYGNL